MRRQTMNRIFTIVATLTAIGASVWANPAAAWASAVTVKRSGETGASTPK